MKPLPLFRQAFPIIVFCYLAAAMGAAPGRAEVLLSLVNSGGSGTSGTVMAGSVFDVSAYLTITGAEPVLGVDYFLQADAGASGLLSIASRNVVTGGSTFSNASAYYTDSDVASVPASVLAPGNADDLGEGAGDAATTLGNGVWHLADYVIQANASLTPGTYTLSLAALPTTGWFDTAFEDHAFDSLGSYSITVVAAPELSITWMLIAAAGITLGLRRIKLLLRN